MSPTTILPIPQLPLERERELIRRWQQHRDHAAARDVVCSMTGYVRHVVKKATKHHRVPFEDLEAAGLIGVSKALERSDTERGLRFATYAVDWIRAEVVDELMRSWSVVAIGNGKLRQLFWRLLRHDGEEGTTFEFKTQRVSVSASELQEMLGVVRGVADSLDAPIGEGETPRVTFLPGSSDQHAELEAREAKRTLRRACLHVRSMVQGRDLAILDRRVANPEPETRTAIAREWGVSHQAVENRERRVMEKLRRKVKPSAVLREALEMAPA